METNPEGSPSGWVPPCNEAMYAAEIAMYTEQVAVGTLPELPNGFRFVFDPVGHDDPYFSGIIPAEQYTWHLAMRQVAISLPHRSDHSHDMAHVPGFRRMLSHPLYADVVQLAAFNSLGNAELCKIFTDAHDHFADQMLYLYRDDGFNQPANFPQARGHLDTLVGLAFMNVGYAAEETRSRHRDILDQLAVLFELAEYEHWYDTDFERFEVL